MRAALLLVADGIGLTWRVGGALVRAAVAGVVGMMVGFVVFAILGLLVPKEWGNLVWNGGILLSGVVGAISAFLDTVRSPPPPDVMGSAAWAGVREVAADLAAPALARDPAALLVGRGKDRGGEPLRYAGPAHLLTLAPTRSGKGVGTVLPNLLLAPRPVVCVDPKGENARIAARARRRLGPVWVLDPFGASGQPAACYDPAASLDPLSPDLADDAATLADALVFDAPGQVAEAHWNEEAKALIAGLLMHLACQGLTGAGGGRRSPGESRWTVRGASPALPVPGDTPDGHRGLPGLRRLLTLPPREWQALLYALVADTGAAGGLVARAAARHLGKADREAAGVLSAAQRHTHFLDSPRIAASMSRSDFRWAHLRDGAATVFLVLPPDRMVAYARWLRLLVAQGISELARAPQRPGTPPVLLLLDEFAALGRLEPVLSAAGLMAGLGLQLWPILQDLAQLRAAYGESASTFLANSGLVQVAAPNDLDTATWLSKVLGNATVMYETSSSGSSRPAGLAILSGGSQATVSESTSTHLTSRPLLTPDEAMRLPPHLQVLLRPGKPPALAGKLRHYADPEFTGLFDE